MAVMETMTAEQQDALAEVVNISFSLGVSSLDRLLAETAKLG